MRETSTRRRSFLKAAGTAGSIGMLGLAGCSGDGGDGDSGGDSGGGDGDSGDGGTPTETEVETLSGNRFTYAGTESGSAPYQLGLTWANQISSETDYEISVQTTGGFNANMRQIGSDSIDMGAGSTPDFQAGDMAHPPFENSFEVNLMFTCAAYPFPIAFTTTDTDIDYLKDTAGKRVVTGLPGSTVHTYFRLYMLANEFGWEETEPVRIGGEEAFQNLQDGQVAAVITAGINNILGPQARRFIQTADNPKLVVPDGREPIDKLINAKDYLDNWNITGGVEWEYNMTRLGAAWENSVYSDRETYATVAGTNTHYTQLDMPDEAVKAMVDVAIEQRSTLAEGTALWAGFAQQPETFATLMTMEDAEAAPYHPGAVQSLKEHDLWDDSMPVAER